MKKFILPLLVLLFVGSLFAVDSEPSAVVGYFKRTIPEGGWKSFTLPFAYDATVRTPDGVFADQFSDGDQISEIREGTSADYIDGYGWYGDLEQLDYGYAYWAVRADGNGPIDYFLMGTVDPQPFTINFPSDTWSAFGLNEPIEVALEGLFGMNPTDGDVVSDVDDGTASDYIDGYGWYGDLENLEPTRAYYFVTTPDSPGFSWTYTPGAGRSTNNSLSKINASSKK